MTAPRPPRLAAALLARVVPRGWAGEALLADLEEDLRERAARGAASAHAWYCRATVQLAVRNQRTR